MDRWNILLAVLFGPLPAALAIAQPLPPTPRAVDPGPFAARRERIDSQLENNSKSAEQLFRLLDSIAQEDVESSRALEQHLDVIDHHNDVLYEELETLDRQQYINDRRADWLLQIQNLGSHADQMRRQNRHLEAAGLDAKAIQLQRALDDGSWLRRAEQEWNCDVKEENSAQEVKSLRNEIAALRKETSVLRQEVADLREVVRQLVAELKKK